MDAKGDVLLAADTRCQGVWIERRPIHILQELVLIKVRLKGNTTKYRAFGLPNGGINVGTGPKYGWSGSPGWGNGSYSDGWLEGPGNWFNLPPVDHLDSLFQEHDSGFNVPLDQLLGPTGQIYKLNLTQALIRSIGTSSPDGPFGAIYGFLAIQFFTIYDMGLQN